MNRALFLVALCVALALPAASVEAHEFWLAPSRYVAQPGVEVEVKALTGEGFRGERKSWSPAHCVRFVARTARAVDLTRAAAPGDFVWARFAASDVGGAMLAFESGFMPIELPAPQFNAYLKEEGLDGPLAERRRSGAEKPGRERYRRCAKAWLAGQDAERATTALGLPLEIVPLAVPGIEPVLHARVLWNGRPLPGALVNAWRAPLGIGGSSTDAATRDSLGIAWKGRTDVRGEVSVPVASAGEWLVSLVHMAPCEARDEADWESTWASLTFERTAEGRRRHHGEAGDRFRLPPVHPVSRRHTDFGIYSPVFGSTTGRMGNVRRQALPEPESGGVHEITHAVSVRPPSPSARMQLHSAGH